jgi:hypothetical protein
VNQFGLLQKAVDILKDRSEHRESGYYDLNDGLEAYLQEIVLGLNWATFQRSSKPIYCLFDESFPSMRKGA